MKKILFLLLTISLLQDFLLVPKAQAQVNVQDSLALVALYNSTNGNNWTCGCNENWLQTPVNLWDGISVENNRVTSISLYSGVMSCGPCNLSGTIPPEIGLLTNLNSLWLANNPNLTGPIPSEIGNLSLLQSLNLTHCNLNGNIPTQIGNIESLVELMLSENQFSGQIPETLGNLLNLKNLGLSKNVFNGNIPYQLGNLFNLQTINLSENLLIGNIPFQISNLLNLKSLGLSKNKLTGPIPSWLGNFSSSNFIILGLDNNNFTGNFPSNVLNLQNIKVITLNNNKLFSVPDFRSLLHLVVLKLDNNNLSFEDLEPNISISCNEYTYSPQDSVNTQIDTSIQMNSTVIFKTSVGGLYNQYQWFHNSTAVLSATDSIYSISSFSASDTGIYTCRITNTLVTGLTLWRHHIHAHLGPVKIDELQSIEDCKTWIQKNIVYVNFSNELSEPLNVGVFLPDGRTLLNVIISKGLKNIEIPLPQNVSGSFLIKMYSNRINISKLLINFN